MVTNTNNEYLTTLSDVQLERLYNRFYDRIERRFEGGTRYGIDLPTLHVCYPEAYEAYCLLRNEGRRRANERGMNDPLPC